MKKILFVAIFLISMMSVFAALRPIDNYDYKNHYNLTNVQYITAGNICYSNGTGCLIVDTAKFYNKTESIAIFLLNNGTSQLTGNWHYGDKNINGTGNITAFSIMANGYHSNPDTLLGYANARLISSLSGRLMLEYKSASDGNNTVWQIDNGGDSIRFFNESTVFVRINKTGLFEGQDRVCTATNGICAASLLSGTGTNNTIPMWTSVNTLGDSPIKREYTDEEFMTIYNGTIYIDETNAVVGVNIIPGAESHSQAFQVNTKLHLMEGLLTISSSAYNSALDVTLMHANSTLPESFTDATNIFIGTSNYYVFQLINSTAFYISGNHVVNTHNWSYQPAPYIDVNGPTSEERGYSISQDGQWKWAWNIPYNSVDDKKLCFQQSDLFYNGLNNIMCLQNNNGQPELQASGRITAVDNIYVGYGTGVTSLNSTTRPSGMFLPKKYIGIDTTNQDDAGFVMGHNGLPVWDISTFVGENAEYLHLGINYRSGVTSMLLSQSGRVGINKPTNYMKYHVGFNGTGLNDMNTSGVYTGQYINQFEIRASNATAFQWRTNINNRGFGDFSANITITGMPQAIYKGINITFASTVGHTAGDVWYFNAFPPLPQGTVTINPSFYEEVIFYNGSHYSDDTFEAGTTNGVLSSSFSKTTQYIYVGRYVPFRSSYFNLQTAGSGYNIKAEYYNGTTWKTLTQSTNVLIDDTLNLTKSGKIYWDASTLSDWATNVNVDTYTPANEIYWIRYSTTATPTVTAKVLTLTPQGIPRLSIYQSAFDTTPVFKVDPNGDTVISGTLQANGFYAEGYNGTLGTYTLGNNVWMNITGFTSGELSGWTASGTSGTIFIFTCVTPGLYDVSYSVNGAVAGNDVLNYQVLVNGIVETKGDITYRYSIGNAALVTNRFLRRFVAGDTMYLQVRDTSAGRVFTYDNRNILLVRIGN